MSATPLAGLPASMPRRRGRPPGSRSFRPNPILERGDGTIIIVLDDEHQAIIDAEEYPDVKNFRWRAKCGANGWKAEAFAVAPNGRQTVIALQRQIAHANVNQNISALDGDLLHCRKENLTIPGSGCTVAGTPCAKRLEKRAIFRSIHSPTCDWKEDPRYRIIPLGDELATIIDAEDWPLVKDYAWYCSRIDDRHWYAAAYVRGSAHRVGGEKFGEKLIYMHKLLVDPETGMYVDHQHGNTLDNRRSVSIRESTPQQNAQNQARDRRIANLEAEVAALRERCFFIDPVGYAESPMGISETRLLNVLSG